MLGSSCILRQLYVVCTDAELLPIFVIHVAKYFQISIASKLKVGYNSNLQLARLPFKEASKEHPTKLLIISLGDTITNTI